MEKEKLITLMLFATAAFGIPLVCMLRGCPTSATSGQTRPDQTTVFFDNTPDTKTAAD